MWDEIINQGKIVKVPQFENNCGLRVSNVANDDFIEFPLSAIRIAGCGLQNQKKKNI